MWDVAAAQQSCSSSSVLEAAIVFLWGRMLPDSISSSADQFLDFHFGHRGRHSGSHLVNHDPFCPLCLSCSGELVELCLRAGVFLLQCLLSNLTTSFTGLEWLTHFLNMYHTQLTAYKVKYTFLKLWSLKWMLYFILECGCLLFFQQFDQFPILIWWSSIMFIILLSWGTNS